MSQVTVQSVSVTGLNMVNVNLTHVLEGHSRDVLCLDAEDDKVVSGSLDKTIRMYRLGPAGQYRLVHTLTGHTLKVGQPVRFPFSGLPFLISFFHCPFLFSDALFFVDALFQFPLPFPFPASLPFSFSDSSPFQK